MSIKNNETHIAEKNGMIDPGAPRVSVVIVSYNGLELLKTCLPSVVASNYPNLEIILADNASTDGSADWVAARFPTVIIVRHPENWAFCRGNNVAARIASGRYLVLLNNDVEVSCRWLEPLVDRMESECDIAAIQPKMLQYTDRTQFEYAGGAGGHLDRYGFPFTRGRILFHMEKDHGQYDSTSDVFWATGAAILIRKNLYDQLGGLDERLWMHMEEIDLCWRLRRHGYRIVAEPSSRVFHIGGASLPAYSPQKAYLNYRNSLLVLYKNTPIKEYRSLFPFRLLLDIVAFVRSLVRFRWAEAHAILRAYRDFYRMRSDFREHADVLSDEQQTPVLPDYRSSIVKAYFLEGKKRFSDLRPERFVGLQQVITEDDPQIESSRYPDRSPGGRA